jgi:NAD(P)-dependent dehydrogenase (short-subunit alcohol dehydrogenase family)
VSRPLKPQKSTKTGKAAEATKSAQSDNRDVAADKPKPPFPEQHQEHPGLEQRMTPRPEYKGAHYRPAGKLEGKVAIITGGDSGIGRSVAYLFAREGADVAIVHLEAEQADAREVRDEIRALGRRALLIQGDVRDPKFCDQAVGQTVETFGQLNILVNNAAYQHRHESLEEITDEDWDRTFRTNIYGYFYMARAALKHMNSGDAIVNCGSITGLEGNKELLDYSSTKGAIHAFTKSLAQNLVDKGIRVNCVSPGPVWTPLNVVDKPADEAGKHGQQAPMKRPAQPDEIAPAFVFFASQGDSSYITGEVLTLLGGETAAA